MAFLPIHRNALGCYLVLYIVTGTCKLNLLAMLYDSQSIHLASNSPHSQVPSEKLGQGLGTRLHTPHVLDKLTNTNVAGSLDPFTLP